MTVYFPEDDYGPLTTVDEVLERMEEEPSERLVEVIQNMILNASDEVRFIAGKDWTIGSVPKPIGRIVAAAVARWAANPDGLIQSRAGDETLAWGDAGEDAGTVRFTKRELGRIEALATRSKKFGTIALKADTVGSCSRNGVIYVRGRTNGYSVDPEPFPFITVDDYHRFVVGGG